MKVKSQELELITNSSQKKKFLLPDDNSHYHIKRNSELLTPSRRQRKKYEERLQSLRRSASRAKSQMNSQREPMGRRNNPI